MPSSDLVYYAQPGLWERGGPLDQRAEQERASLVTREILRLEPARVLEIGAGNGIITNRLLSAGLDVVASDVSSEALSWIDGPSVVAGAEELPFEDRAFDLTVASEVLEHLSDDSLERAVTELARVTSRWLVITVPNRQDLIATAVVCPRCHCRFHPDRHVQTFTPSRLASLVPGFRALRVTPIGPAEWHRGRVEVIVRRDLLGRLNEWTPFAICPQCGYQRGRSPNATQSARHTRAILRPLRKRRRRWLLVVLERPVRP